MLPAVMIANLTETINLITTQTHCEWRFLQTCRKRAKLQITLTISHFSSTLRQLHKKPNVTAARHKLDRKTGRVSVRWSQELALTQPGVGERLRQQVNNCWRQTLPDESKLCDMLRGRMTDRYAHVWRGKKKERMWNNCEKDEEKSLKNGQ